MANVGDWTLSIRFVTVAEHANGRTGQSISPHARKFGQSKRPFSRRLHPILPAKTAYLSLQPGREAPRRDGSPLRPCLPYALHPSLGRRRVVPYADSLRALGTIQQQTALASMQCYGAKASIQRYKQAYKGIEQPYNVIEPSKHTSKASVQYYKASMQRATIQCYKASIPWYRATIQCYKASQAYSIIKQAYHCIEQPYHEQPYHGIEASIPWYRASIKCYKARQAYSIINQAYKEQACNLVEQAYKVIEQAYNFIQKGKHTML
eukprot:g23757.t1